MVIDGKKKDLFGESPSKGDSSVLGECPCSARVFFYKRDYSAADGHLG